MQKLETISARLLRGIGIVLFVLLTVTSLIFTRFFQMDYQSEIPYNQVDFFVITLAGTVILAALSLWLSSFLLRREETAERNLKILLAVVLCWMLAAGFLWIALAKSTPVSDQNMIYTSAQRFNEGNFERLTYGKYLYYYPFQLGLTAWESLILRIFGQENCQALQAFNVLGTVLGVYAGYRVTRLLSKKKQAAAAYLLFMAGCFPLIVYGVYVYSDVLALVLCMTAVWQFLRYVKEEKKSGAVLMVLCFAAAVLLRNNSLIVMIAVLCVLFVKALSRKRWQYLICAAAILAASLGSGPALKSYYEHKTGVEVNDGMPSILWIAMGMQESDKEAGWYNGYSIYIYQDVCKYHSETAGKLGYAEVKARAKEFLKDPFYAADFYFRKFSSQWAEPTYGCFIMTYATEHERSPFAESLYTGWPNRLLQKYMDSYQILIYGLALFLLIYKAGRKEQEPLEWYVLLIAVIGGVLFHELWEAKSRYVFPYFVMMIPMAAGGLAELSGCIRKWRTKDEAYQGG